MTIEEQERLRGACIELQRTVEKLTAELERINAALNPPPRPADYFTPIE